MAALARSVSIIDEAGEDYFAGVKWCLTNSDTDRDIAYIRSLLYNFFRGR